MRKSKTGYMHTNLSEAKTHLSSLIKMMHTQEIKAVMIRRHHKVVALVLPLTEHGGTLPDDIGYYGTMPPHKKPAG